MRFRLLALALLACLAACGSGNAQLPRPSPTPSPQAPVVLNLFISHLQAPVYVTNAGDGSHRLFAVEQAGKIWSFDADGTKHAQPFLDITSLVLYNGERGLLSVAFHPHYAQNGFFFVDYTDQQGTINVVRYHVSASDANVADPTSAKVILTIPHPVANHNGGQLQFSQDGYLYISVGDGGEGQSANAQSTATLLGKLLRIDVDHPAARQAYAIPPSNPFVHQAGARPEIWAYGLRNPWRFSFDRATGDLYIADVGGGTWEEVDVQSHASKGGENYGWNAWEGTLCSVDAAECAQPKFTPPTLEYTHGVSNCAIGGGYVYRGKRYPNLQGLYFLGDYCSGHLWSAMTPIPAQRAKPDQLLQSPYQIVAFGEDEDGELYIVDLGGNIVKVTGRTA